MLMTLCCASKDYATALETGASTEYIDHHNFGYVLRKQREKVQVAMYEARLIYHLQIPQWQHIEFEQDNHEGDENRNISLACVQLRVVLNMIRYV